MSIRASYFVNPLIMKRYMIKYEDMRGNVHTEEVSGWDYETAKAQLKHPVSEIYWSEPITLY